MRRILAGTILAIAGSSMLRAQDDAKLLSGPKPGAEMPAAFESLNINGTAHSRPRCLVCKFALSPTLLIFAKEAPEDKQPVLNEFLDKLDAAILEYVDRNFCVGVVFLSPDALDSTNNAKEQDSAKIIEEAVKREELLKRLRPRAFGFEVSEQNKQVTIERVLEKSPAALADLKKGDLIVEAKLEDDEKFKKIEAMEDLYAQLGRVPLGTALKLKIKRDMNDQELALKAKNVIVSCYPAEGPKMYDINPKAEFTILLYDRMKILNNWTYAPGKLNEEETMKILMRIGDVVPQKKKAAKD